MPKKKIYLNQRYNDAVLASTLVHEARHSQQKVASYSPEYSAYTAIGVVRAKEADAMAHQCVAAFEMAQKGDYMPLAMFTLKHGKVAEACTQSNGDLNQTFQAWYSDYRFVSQYDNAALDRMELRQSMFSHNAYKTVMDNAVLARAVCHNDGKPYVAASFFDKQEARTVTERQAERAASVESWHMRNWKHLGKGPTSADYFYIRKNDGSVLPPKRQTNQYRDVAFNRRLSVQR